MGEMPLTEILKRKLERKRKYVWSCGTNRNRLVTITCFIFALCLLYLTIYSTLDLGTNDITSTAKLKLLQVVLDQHHRSPSDYNGRKFSGNSNKQNNMLSGDIIDADHGSKNLTMSIMTQISQKFNKADKDGNQWLDENELATWINERIHDHFSTAMKHNFEHYFVIDTNPKNGLVSWEEYLNFFFKNKAITGVTADDILNRTPVFQALSRDIKVEIARIQARWSEASLNDPEFLTVDEFLAFEHPEASPTKILSLVQDTFATFDLDGDETISKDEFDTVYKNAEGVDPVFKRDKSVIDANGDGDISRIELMKYMNPRSSHHSQKEARDLMKSADRDGNKRLSLLEMVQSANIIVKSKFYDVEHNFHDHQ